MVNVNGGGLFGHQCDPKTGNLTIGQTGGGTVAVTNNGLLIADQITFGATAGAAGTLTVSSGGLVVLTNSALQLGQVAGGIGALNLNNNGVFLTTNTSLVPIGANGFGGLTLNGGSLSNLTSGAVNTLSSVILGQTSTATGNLTVANGTLTITNNSSIGQLIVGENGVGVLNLSNAGVINVTQLLVTNNIMTGTVAANNSVFNFIGGTLTTSNSNQLASFILVPSNATFSINGTWNMVAGTEQ